MERESFGGTIKRAAPIIGALILMILAANLVTSASTLEVGKAGYPYSKIQDALNAARPGDTIVVKDGAVYEESLTIPMDNITLDLNGATVRGTYVEDVGISLNDRSHVTIKNGAVQNFAFAAIQLVNSDNNRVENMRTENSRSGVFLWNSNYNILTNNVANNSKNCGIFLNNGSSHNTISNNDVNWNGECGLAAYDGTNYNVFENNLASNQKYEFGINLGHSANFNQIINNTANSNYWSGITLHHNCENNTVENNVANSNRQNGIHIMFGSSHNLIRNNTALNNGEWQIIDDETCVGNTFSNNTVEAVEGEQTEDYLPATTSVETVVETVQVPNMGKALTVIVPALAAIIGAIVILHKRGVRAISLVVVGVIVIAVSAAGGYFLMMETVTKEVAGTSLKTTQLTISPSTLTLEEGKSITLTATLISDNNPLNNENVSWSATSGGFDTVSGATDSSGRAQVTYTAPTVNAQASVVITASFGGDNQHQGSTENLSATITPAQNDACIGRDASNIDSVQDSDNVTPGSYTGYLDNLDIYDCYKIYLNSGQTISIAMTPPTGADFDLILYDHDLGWIEGSLKFGSGADSVSYTTTSSGYYPFRIRQWQGSGTYSFSLSVS